MQPKRILTLLTVNLEDEGRMSLRNVSFLVKVYTIIVGLKEIIGRPMYVTRKFMELTVQAVVRMQVRNISMTAAY
jgi:hypothetical protein